VKDYKASRAPDATSRWLRLRVWVMGAFFFGLLGVVSLRAAHLQIVEKSRLRELAEDQYVRQIEIPARRGDIFDRRGVPLAQSVDVDSVWVDPSLLPDLKGAARLLAKKLELDEKELLGRLTKAKRFVWLKRQIRPSEVDSVKALGLAGVGFTKEPRRFYPQRELASQVVGIVGQDGHGLEGLELAFEDELSGQGGQVSSLRDARGRKLLLEGASPQVERQGASMTLTLDRHLQYVTERALAKAVEDARALAGTAVVLEPSTGEILALAQFPSFNPNTPKETSRDSMRNRAALDAFEPGSTMKPFVIAASLEEKTIQPGNTFFCENGAWALGGHTLHDTHPYGWLTPARVLHVSSNICTAKIAQLLGRERLALYYQKFGFGQRAGLVLPGESRGSVPFPKAEISLATQSFGQGMSATAVQLAAAYGALGNGGRLMRPYLVSKMVDPDGVVLVEHHPTPVRQVVSMMEGVVQKEGTAPRAQMAEYRVAGKTGTAQKPDPVARGYSDKRIASFAGLVPAEAPRVAILVLIDEPKTDVYGGLVAAPAFKEIAQAAMPHLGVQPSGNGVSRPLLADGTIRSEGRGPPGDENIRSEDRVFSAEGTARSEGRGSPRPERDPGGTGGGRSPPPAPKEAVTDGTETGRVKVPDVEGRVGREAVSRILGVQLEPKIVGSGRVVSQRPPPGSLVIKGTRVTVELAARQ